MPESSSLPGPRFLLAALALAAVAPPSGADLPTRELCGDAVPRVAKAHAGVLEPVRREGHCLAGDFNGDGMLDVIMVVKVLVDRIPAAAGIKTLYPFYDKEGGKGRLQFLALHTRAGRAPADWSQSERLLLDGRSPILVLHDPDMASDMERVTRSSKEVRELRVPRRALRGEAVHLGTQAVSAILYWNGKTYVLHEDPAGP